MNLKADRFGIHDRLYSFEHNYLLDATLYGEPRFDDHVIWYADSHTERANVSVCLYPFPRGDRNAEESALHFISAKIEDFRNRNINSLKIFGSRRLLAEVAGKHPGAEYYYRSPLESGDFLLASDSLKPQAKRAYQRSLEEGYTLSENRSRIASADQINMLRSTISRKKYLPVDRMFASLFSLWCCRDDVRVFDVHRNGAVIGFFVMHEWSPRLAFHLLTVSASDERYFGDFTLGEMYTLYARGGGSVMLGPAVTAGLESFKKKWGKPTGAEALDGLLFTHAAAPEEYKRHHFIWFLEAANLWMTTEQS